MNAHRTPLDHYLPSRRQGHSPAARHLLAGSAARMVAALLVDFDPRPDWKLDGACNSHGDLFAAVAESAPDATWPPIDEARTVCAGCPVRVTCLLSSLLHREEAGMWGGLMPEERDPLVRARRAPHRQALAGGDAVAEVVADLSLSLRDAAARTGLDKDRVAQLRARIADQQVAA